jgi:hypothetical protein
MNFLLSLSELKRKSMIHVHDVTYRLHMSHRKRTLADENSPVPDTPPPLQKRSSHFINTFSTPLTNNCLQTPSQSSSFEFVDAFTPIPKRRKLRPIAAEDTPSSTRIIQDHVAAERRREQERKAFQEQEKRQLEDEEKTEQDRLNKAFKLIEGVGYPTLYTFLQVLLTTKDQYRSSQVSRMLSQHGNSILDSICRCRPKVANDWAISTVHQLVATEGERLAQQFKPDPQQPVLEILNFSMTKFLAQAELLAPSTCQLLRQIGFLSLRPKREAIKGTWCVFPFYL